MGIRTTFSGSAMIDRHEALEYPIGIYLIVRVNGDLKIGDLVTRFKTKEEASDARFKQWHHLGDRNEYIILSDEEKDKLESISFDHCFGSEEYSS